MNKINVLLTGGSRGIGEAIKFKFQKEGCNVISPTSSEMNLSSEDSINSFLANIEKPIDILINNAGINIPESFEEISLQSLYKTLHINTIAPFILSQYCINKFFLNKNKGCIINIGTLWLSKSRPGRTTYSLSKSALESLTRSIAVEYGRNNIRCNMVSPGFIGTDLTYQNNTQEELDIIIEKVPMKRLGLTKEIADLVVYLSLKNDFITGENIYIDGGVSKSF
jgi:NAD(P)-dependent dehydrogenase (short-subunit alcohol dehydrogenase family)